MRIARLILIAALVVIGVADPATRHAEAAPAAPTTSAPARSFVIRADPWSSDFRVPLPDWLQEQMRAQNLVGAVPEPGGPSPRLAQVATPASVDSFRWVVRFNRTAPDGTCVGPLAPWPVEAMDAFLYAVRIWAGIINSSQRIDIDACWHRGMTPGGELAHAGPTIDYADFPGAPHAGIYYPVALANQLAGADQNGSAAEITATVIGAWDWYYGTDATPPSTQYDLVSVVLHELGHGLGFGSEFAYVCGAQCTGTWGTFLTIYDSLVQNIKAQKLAGTFANNSVELGAQLVSDKLYFGGPLAFTANGGGWPKLYDPTTWDGGSSVGHLDSKTYDHTVNALMTPSTALGEAEYYPGPVALAVLADMGWPVPSLLNTYVNTGNTSGNEDGSAGYPFNTVQEGVNAVAVGGTVYITAGTYVGAVNIPARAMTLRATGGAVIIRR